MRATVLRSFGALLAAVMLLGAATPAVAGNLDKPRPFHGVFMSSGDPVQPTITCEVGVPLAVEGAGHGNHIGHFTYRSDYCLEFVAATHVVVTGAMGTVDAANGDLLYSTFDAEGEFLPDGTLVGNLYATYAGGTGRFENAVGSAVFTGGTLPGGGSYYTFEGTLAFDASDRSR